MSLDLSQLWADAAAGGRRSLAKVLSIVEGADSTALRELMRLAHPTSGAAQVVGITGAPGVGKSSLTSAVIGELRRRGRRVGVLAIDPTSPYTGGAVLGDRLRMHDHADDNGVFIRSMAARGRLGGLSDATPWAVVLLAGAGFDVVIIETVGVGQSEVALAAAADTVVLVLAPGLGDAVQAEKAGIMEIADVFVVNKADLGGAGQVSSTIAGAIDDHSSGWVRPVLRTVALRGEGVAELVDTIEAHYAALVTDGKLFERRAARAELQIESAVLDRIRRRSRSRVDGDMLAEVAARVARQELDPYAAVDLILAQQGG